MIDIYSGDTDRQLKAVKKFRKLLSKDDRPIEKIEEVIECGVVPRFVEILRGNDSVLQVKFIHSPYIT